MLLKTCCALTRDDKEVLVAAPARGDHSGPGHDIEHVGRLQDAGHDAKAKAGDCGVWEQGQVSAARRGGENKEHREETKCSPSAMRSRVMRTPVSSGLSVLRPFSALLQAGHGGEERGGKGHVRRGKKSSTVRSRHFYAQEQLPPEPAEQLLQRHGHKDREPKVALHSNERKGMGLDG